MKYKKYIYIVVAIIVVITLTAVSRLNIREYSVTIDDALDTISTVTVVGNSECEGYLEKCYEMIDYYDKTLSATDCESELYSLNKEREAKVSDDIIEMISGCEEYYYESDGAFDITVGTLSEEWNKAIKAGTVLSDDAIKRFLTTADYESLKIDRTNGRICIDTENQKITLGAVAKGYIADKLAQYLKSQDIKGAMINLGGNIYTYGTKENNNIWKIGIRDPKTADKIIGTLNITDRFIITSGDYERYVEKDGKRYHHIIDANTGYPVDNGLHSVTIISGNGFDADALSTLCFLQGIEKGVQTVEKHGVQAIFVCDDKIYYSEELEDIFDNRSEEYDYIPY